MKCPYCETPNSRVLDSRATREGREVRRRRLCGECGRRFTTREQTASQAPKVAKRDGRREDYSRAKLEQSIQRACVKRPVSADDLKRLAERVEQILEESAAAEVESKTVGEMVLQELRALDVLAAARFASVFHNFGRAADYEQFFAKPKGRGKK